jgi:hypothetical protein
LIPHQCQTLPKFTLIEHCPFGSNCGAAAIHQQHEIVFHYQAIVSTPILKEIAQKLAKILPIKREPFHTPLKIDLDQTSLFWKQPRHRSRNPMIHNGPSQPSYGLYSNFCGNYSRSHEDKPNQA